jgi:hypothetical protein
MEGGAAGLGNQTQPQECEQLQKLVTHYAVYKFIHDAFQHRGQDLEDANAEFQVNKYYTCFYDVKNDKHGNAHTPDRSGTTVVDRTFRTGDRAINPLVGSSEFQLFRGMCGLYPGCVKVRHQPCCCPEACNKGQYQLCKYAEFAGEWHDYFITPRGKYNEGTEAKRRQGLVAAAQDLFFNSVVEGQLLAFVDCGQEVSFCVASKKKPPAISAKLIPQVSTSGGGSRSRSRGGGVQLQPENRSRSRGGGTTASTTSSSSTSDEPVLRFSKENGDKYIYVRHLEVGTGVDQYTRRGTTVQLLEESLMPATLKADSYTGTDAEYYIPTTIKQQLWHSFAFTKWRSGKGERYLWMN